MHVFNIDHENIDVFSAETGDRKLINFQICCRSLSDRDSDKQSPHNKWKL